MKAVISNRIYLEVTPEQKDELSRQLTYKIPGFSQNDPPQIIKNMVRIRSNLVSIPSGRTDLIPKEYEIVDKRLEVPIDFPKFKFDLRDSQKEVYDQIDDSAIINAWVSWGKAQPLYSKIKTPNGWTSMGDIQVGDKVTTPSGKSSVVTGKYPHSDKEIYRITLADGRYVDACSEHLWSYYIRDSKVLKTNNTKTLIKLLEQGRSVSIPLTSQVRPEVENCKFPIHPYVLGVLLGDGGISTNSIVISSADKFILDKVSSLLPKGHSLNKRKGSKYDYGLSGDNKKNLVLDELRRLNLLGTTSDTKFIPEEYKNLNLEDTLSLIQGLMDSDGSVEASRKSCEYTTVSKQLMYDFCELIYSLGGCAKIQKRLTSYTYKDEKKLGKVSYRTRPSKLAFEVKSKLTSLPRKNLEPGKLDDSNRVKVTSIELLGKMDCACISIDSEDKLYLTDNYVVTHNTFTGLAIAGKLGQKTLVVTHTVALRNQWAKEVEKVFGIKAGIIGSGQFDLDSPIVIGNTQTLYRNIDKIKDQFGTIILDEMHHVSSPTFAKIIDTNYARYKIGLSGTIERKDGKHVVFRDYFGSRLFQPPKENFLTPDVHIVKSEVRFMDGASVPWAKRVNALTNNEEYVHTVAMLAASYAARGHKVLLVSDRVHFLKACADLIGENAVCVTGEVSHEEREKLVSEILHKKEKNVLCGTQSIFAEGISVNTLSCLILGTPVNNEPLLTQLVGRVIRKNEGKGVPVVVDIHLKGSTASRQASNRMGFYMKQGWDIKQL
jgi:hypothetical protein